MFFLLRWIEDRLLLERLKRQLQPLADKRFGKGEVLVQGERIASGSVIAIFSLIVTVKTVFEFVAKYKDFKDGLAEMAKDAKRSEEAFEKAARKHFPPEPQSGQPVPNAAKAEGVKSSLAAMAASVAAFELVSFFVSMIWTGLLNSHHFDGVPTSEMMNDYITHSPVAMAGVGIINLISLILGGGVAGYTAGRSEFKHAVAFWLASLFVETLLFMFAPDTILIKWPPLYAAVLVILSLPFALAGGMIAKIISVLDWA